MSDTPSELKYTSSHEWARVEEDGSVTVGISDHAQQLLGDMVFVELPELETAVNVGAECAVVESVKSASDVYSPVSGEIIAVNTDLGDSPALVNSDPYGDGWLFQVQPNDKTELDDLMDADTYQSQTSDE